MLDEVTMVCDAGPLAANQTLHVDVYFFISAIGYGTVRNVMLAGAPGAYEEGGGAGSEIELPTNPVPTSLLLESYTLTKTETSLIVMWKTISEFRTAGFRLWRSESPDRNQAILLTPEGIPAIGVGSLYTYEDTSVHKGVTYWYWLQEITSDGGGWEYSVLSGRIGDINLYLPVIANDTAQPVAPAPSAADGTPTATPVPTATPSPMPTAPLPTIPPSVMETPTPVPSDTPAPTPTSASTETPTPIAAPTETPTLIAALTETPTPVPSDTPAPTPTSAPTETPTPVLVTDTAPSANSEIPATLLAPVLPLLPVDATPTPFTMLETAPVDGLAPASQ
jgi:hypothetical protein